jgi:uncharacterized repeat protein (TIGR03803 family)
MAGRVEFRRKTDSSRPHHPLPGACRGKRYAGWPVRLLACLACLPDALGAIMLTPPKNSMNHLKQIVTALGKLSSGNRACTIFMLYATLAIALPAQTFTTLHSFDGLNGAEPFAALVQGTDGNFYGTTYRGGANGSAGTVFRVTRLGALTTLFTFCSQAECTDGYEPYAGLVQALDGNFYGTTSNGGANTAGGTIFKITPGGALTTIYSLGSQGGSTDGSHPQAGLVQAANGDFYGTTTEGGANGSGGTVFKITPAGTLTTLHSFCPQGDCSDGAVPEAGLVQATNGDFYGTTTQGGANLGGTVFRITPSGALTTLYSFCSQSGCTDGEDPHAGLVQGTNGNLYGTTFEGGDNFGGTIFEITQGGTLTTLYSFCAKSGCPDGENPRAGLVRATNGDFYGRTEGGGANGQGTIFEITPSGTLTTLHSFDASDMGEPSAGLVQATNGAFYGATTFGGTSDLGTVFRLSVGLGPFVETQTTSGKVGEVIKILGTDLTGATSVSFNGTAALFTVVAPSLIITAIPAGATSGTIQVGLPSGTLVSNEPFHVLP